MWTKLCSADDSAWKCLLMGSLMASLQNEVRWAINIVFIKVHIMPPNINRLCCTVLLPHFGKCRFVSPFKGTPQTQRLTYSNALNKFTSTKKINKCFLCNKQICLLFTLQLQFFKVHTNCAEKLKKEIINHYKNTIKQ